MATEDLVLQQKRDTDRMVAKQKDLLRQHMRQLDDQIRALQDQKNKAQADLSRLP
jgi:hypothetical protein